MTLQDQIKKDLIAAMKARDDERKSALRVILGEFGRLESKTLADDDVIRVLKKLIKAEKEALEKSGAAEESGFIDLARSYLPQMASETEIKEWIRENVDLSQFTNRMQAMKPIMANFGSTAEGNIVRKILQGM